MSTAAEYLTTRELAELLRVKERKVYELASSGALPCTRATGKLLFPRREVDAWLERHRAGGSSAAQVRPNVIVGSHDPLLDWALRESHSGLAALLDGSLDGLARMARGEAIAGGLHLPEGGPEDWNRGHLAEAMPGAPVVLAEWAWREQGLVLASGNPLGIERLADLRGRRFVPRQREAGTYVLLERLLPEAGLAVADLELLDPPARTQTEVALAVAQGRADAGLGLACVARQLKLAFVPIARERYDLAVWRRAWFEPPFQALLALCRSPAFAAKAAELGGYDVSGFGRVHYNGP
jgi:excisionase family DNA binding protein